MAYAKAKELIAYGVWPEAKELMADSIWQEKNARSGVSSGYTPLAIRYKLLKAECAALIVYSISRVE